MCTRQTHQFVDLMAGRMRPLVQHMIGEKEFVALKDEIAQQMIENLPVAIRWVFGVFLAVLKDNNQNNQRRKERISPY